MNPQSTALALLAVIAIAGCGATSADHRPTATATLTHLSGSPPVHAAGAAPARGGALFDAGRRVFVRARCGACHTVAAAGTHGQLGPDFDTSEQLDRTQIRTEIESGANGMPSFADRLTEEQKRAVIEFVFAAMHARPG